MPEPHSKRRRPRLQPLLAGLLGLTIAATGGCQRAPRATPSASLGVIIDGMPASLDPLRDFERMTGARIGLTAWFADWDTPFPLEECRTLNRNGYLPLVTWEPRHWNTGDGVSMADLLAGKHDAYLQTWADGARQYGGPLMIRWGHEFNGDWYPWSVGAPGNSPAQYAAAFRYLHDFFARRGLTQIRWVWCPDAGRPIPPESYPGDAVADWVALDTYNFGASLPNGTWGSFSRILYPGYKWVRTHMPEKPLMIAETSCSEKGGAKPAWIDDLSRCLPARFPGVRALVWFNIDKEADWRAESSPATLEAFRRLCALPYFRPDPAGLLKPGRLSVTEIWQPATGRQTAADPARPVLSIPRRTFVPALDGSLSEWPTEGFVPLDSPGQVVLGRTSWKGADTASASVRPAWDEKGLYLAVRMHSAQPHPNEAPPQAVWNGDAFELNVGLDAAAHPNRLEYGQQDWQIGFPLRPGPVPPVVWKGTGDRVSQIQAACQAGADGYTLEIFIPWTFFAESGLSPRTAARGLDLDFAVDATGHTRTREWQLAWTGDADFFQFPCQWGRGTLQPDRKG